MLKFRFLRAKILISHHSPWSNPIFHAISSGSATSSCSYRGWNTLGPLGEEVFQASQPGDSHRKAYEISFVMIILRYIIRQYIYIYILYLYNPHYSHILYIYIHVYIYIYTHISSVNLYKPHYPSPKIVIR